MTRDIIVLCDGTWCGKRTNTITNIFILFKLIKERVGSNDDKYECENNEITARYFEGVGMSESLPEHVFEGVTANDIDKRIKEAYSFIAKNYNKNDRIWLFGLSRGA